MSLRFWHKGVAHRPLITCLTAQTASTPGEHAASGCIDTTGNAGMAA